MTGKNVIPLKTASPLPSFLSGGQNRNDDGRKEYNLTLSEESGSGYSQKVYLIPVSSARILHSTPYFFITLFPTAFYVRSRMTGRYVIPLKNRTHLYRILTTPVLFYHSARHRILPSFKNDRQECNTVENRITLAVILERRAESE